jgi:hypothetical protein
MNTTHLYRLFIEAEQLEFRLLRQYYYAPSRVRHHRLLSLCQRAHERKQRRRKAYLATQSSSLPLAA